MVSGWDYDCFWVLECVDLVNLLVFLLVSCVLVLGLFAMNVGGWLC